MRFGLFVLFNLALCAAQTTQSDDYIPAPYFDEGENLSFKNCGHEVSPYRWAVSVRNVSNTAWNNELCSGIAISQRTILLTGKCGFSTLDANDLRVSLRACWWTPNDDECMKRDIRVLNITELPFTKVVITEKMPSEVMPICLFNRDNVMRLELQTESPYFEWQHFWIGDYRHWTQKIVTGPGECIKNLSQKELDILKISQIPTKNILCLKDPNHGLGNRILVNQYKSRYFMRAIKFEHGNFYIDILPHIDQIVRNAKGIYALSMPQPTPRKIEFSAPDNLSFPDCGRKPTAESRRKRDNDDFSEDLSPIHHVFGGSTAQESGHPWHAYIENEETGTICGGTLISPTVVLTAAHCLYGSKAEDFIVVLGMYDKRQRTAPGVQRTKVHSLIVHPKYTELISADVGLMILKKKIRITDHIRPICLWNEDSNLDRVAGTIAMVVGFGLVENYTLPDELQEARVPILAHKECYLSKRAFFGKYLRPGDNFCAGYTNGTTTCNGDAGGSLSVEKDGRWFIRGIASFGMSKRVEFEGEERSLCHPNQYLLYTDVASYMNWIVDNTPDITSKN
ncbi:serine protease gd-like [Cloeon dipterum]|uniref:serine protease gd-like n=1 Tax=Cloeon dipterum TaxID=197152 RepID=UPI00322002EF